MASIGSGPFFSATPTITSARLNWKNYLSWFAAVELWFIGQGYHDYLETKISTISEADKSQWQNIDFQLCAVLWRSVEYDVLEMHNPSKYVSLFGRMHKKFLLTISMSL